MCSIGLTLYTATSKNLNTMQLGLKNKYYLKKINLHLIEYKFQSKITIYK